jgi:hypothetical protein
MEILKYSFGKPQGIIRQIAGSQERLYTPAGEAIAIYKSTTRATYNNNGLKIGSGNRLAGMVGQDEE